MSGWLGKCYMDWFVLILDQSLVSHLSTDRFYEGHLVHSCHLVYEFICNVVPCAFPSLILFTAVSFSARKGECYFMAVQMIASHLVPSIWSLGTSYIASWIILSSGFGCLPMLLALCHLLSWCHYSLWVKFNVYKSLCSISSYLLSPIFFTTFISYTWILIFPKHFLASHRKKKSFC